MQLGKKYIHYCWFGGKKLPRLAKKCIKSWKKYLPDYEIICWNEKNTDLNECPFIKEAYEKKKWAFVADYARTKALYEYGGIYLDTDVMIKKDPTFLLDDPAFLGIEDSSYVNAAVWGIKEAHHFLAKEVLDFYRAQPHFNDFDIYSITIPVIVTRILEEHGFSRKKSGVQIVDGVHIYTRDYFYPLSYDRENNTFTDNTCMIHYSDASWTSKTEKRDIRLIRIFGRKNTGTILSIASSIKSLLRFYKNALWRTITLIFFPARFIYKHYIRKNKDTSGFNLKTTINDIKKTETSHLVITHEGWLGVRSSSKELFGDVVTIKGFKITDDLSNLVSAICNNNRIELVIFSAFGEGWEYLARKLKKEKPSLRIKVFWHGSNAMHIEPFDWGRFKCIFDLLNEGVIDSIAFAKKSMFEQYKKLGYNVEFLPNTMILKTEKTEFQREKHNGTRIGIYASGDRWVKNFYNQLAAASLIKDVHVDMVPMTKNAIEFSRILKLSIEGVEDNVSRKEMLQRIANDDIVLYATFVECAPILPLECLELGTLCVTGDNHHYWTGTPLEKYLVEPKVDNPVAVAARVEKCLKNKEEIFRLYKEWKKEYDKYCKEEVKKFLEN